MPQSPSSSPARKRQRLSSPTYDDQVGDLTQEDLDAFDEIEAQLSQKSHLNTQTRRQRAIDTPFPSSKFERKRIDWSDLHTIEPTSSNPSLTFANESNDLGLQDDLDNPFTTGFTSAAAVIAPLPFRPPTMGFASAVKLPIQDDYRSPSPEEPSPGPDVDAWFNPAPMEAPPLFTTAKSIVVPGFVGFTKASTNGVVKPSSEALAKAKALLEVWESEDVNPPSTTHETNLSISFAKVDDSNILKPASVKQPVMSPQRVALRTVENVGNTPGMPPPSGFSHASIAGSFRVMSSPTPLYRPKAFRSPLLKNTHTSNGVMPGSPLNPNRPTNSLLAFSSAASRLLHPLSTSVNVSPGPTSTPQAGFASPSSFMTPLRSSVRPSGVLRTRPAPFVTPFKPGMKPGEPGRSKLGQLPTLATPQLALKAATKKEMPQSRVTSDKPTGLLQRKEFFSLAAPTGRQSLALSGLQPQQYDTQNLESMGINVPMLNQITLETALYYSFHTTSSVPPPSTFSQPTTVLGSAEALKELLDRGCTLATKPWVDNHWCLILWKLAGMVALDPEKETSSNVKRWCWPEVIRQLLYRYERELNSGRRPPLRQIATQDAPAAFPMVLCVSNIFWSPASATDDGLRIEPYPELEVTDGWYRLRAQVDLAMARAVRRGVIRVGRKIGVAGARLSTEKKDPSEILEAYNSTKLILSGNSSQLVAWHTKLGFTRGPCVSTLHSLSADGSVVAAMDLVIIKTHAIAFMQFIEGQDGQKRREGPWNEEEETRINEQWKKRREVEASKIREQLEKKFSRYEKYIDRLERKAGSQFRPGDEDIPPDSIDAFYDELEYPDSAADVFSRISPMEAGWLARHTRKQIELSRESMGDEIEQELKTLCPPREVRSFRILVVQDARTIRRPANRTALLTVWNVLQLSLAEGSSAGSFEFGQRFLITNLQPIQHSAWMDCEPGSEVYLSTRQDTRWTKVKTIGV
ncbi:hypothetical protein BYT27DRAFT_7338672 [Phlegmacium glaucopus]|nr:hypothetical protein BYT27DRAFT_7338672 [Phlegmacium glaucopus]